MKVLTILCVEYLVREVDLSARKKNLRAT